MKGVIAVVALTAIVGFGSNVAIATDSIVYNFVGMELAGYCGGMDIPGGVSFTVDGLEKEACAGVFGCSGITLPEGLLLQSSTLSVHVWDLNIVGVQRVEVDLIEQDPALTASIGNWGQPTEFVAGLGATTLGIDNSGSAMISCCACVILEVRLLGDNIVPVARQSWTALKAQH